jgi:hypothetical protein
VTYTATGGTITAAGLYTAASTAGSFRVIATASGKADTSAVTITAPTITSISLTPATASLQSGQTQQFSVSATLSNGGTQTNPSVTYSATGGTITTGGLYTAGATAGTFQVIAASAAGPADTSAVTVSAATVTAITLTPAAVSLQTGQTQQFSASATLSNGGTLSNPTVTWSATGGTIAASGLYTASGTTGSFSVVAASASGPADTSVVTIVSGPAACIAGVAGSYPNEPAGLTRVFEHDFAVIPNGSNGAAGSDWLVEGGSSNLSIVTDGSATGGDANCLRTRFPNGQSSGEAPVNVNVDTQDGGSSRRTEQYFSLWFMIEGSNYENQAVGTKFGFFGYGESASTALNEGFLVLVGAGTQQIMSSMRLEFWQQNNVSRELSRNVGSGNPVVCGVWNHLELVMIANTVGSSNGEFHMWVNGVKTHQYTNVVYRTASASLGFRAWKWNPTWGGIGGTKTRDDYVRFAHVYLSGK